MDDRKGQAVEPADGENMTGVGSGTLTGALAGLDGGGIAAEAVARGDQGDPGSDAKESVESAAGPGGEGQAQPISR